MSIQIKICGLTNVEEAIACAEAGASAIGFIFYPPSPRFVNLGDARIIREALPSSVTPVGVFVDLPVEEVILTARKVGLKTVQLHGNESIFAVRVLQQEGLRVIKVLRSSGRQLLLEAEEYSLADCLLVEAGHGALPGGNGSTWLWSEAKPLAERMPYILAGGLTAKNISDALRDSGASAVDVSSGAECSPGRKDIQKVKDIISKVRDFTPTTKTGVIFP